jgi:hypothetical protein
MPDIGCEATVRAHDTQEAALVVRTSVIVMAAVLVCCSVQAQSILLKNGEYQLFLQGGYSGCVDNDYNAHATEFDFGYAVSKYFEFGVGIGKNKVNSSAHDLYGLFVNAYPARFGTKTFAEAFGLHGAITYLPGHTSDAYSLGMSWNILAYTSATTGLAFDFGLSGVQAAGRSGADFVEFVGFRPFTRSTSGLTISIPLEYDLIDGPDTFSAGMTIGFGGQR